MGVVQQHLQAESTRIRAESRTVRSGLQHHIELTRRTATSALARERVDLLGIAPVCGRALGAHGRGDELSDHQLVDRVRRHVGPQSLEDRPELGEDLPFVRLTFVKREHRRAVVRDVAHTEPVERDVAVFLLQCARRRKDHVCVPRRLVQVDVHAHHELQLTERLVQLLRVRCGENRVTRQAQEPADGVLARSGDLLCEDGDRVLPHCFGLAAHTTVTTTDGETFAATGRTARGGVPGGRQREHGAAAAVDVARHHVDGVDQPCVQGAELHGVHTDASVHDRARRRAEVAGQLTGDICVDASCCRGVLRGQTRHCDTQFVDAVRERGDSRLGLGESLLEHRVQDRCEEQTVGAGTDGDPLVGVARGLRVARVDRDNASSARTDSFDAAREVGRGAQAAVRLVRVRTQHDEQVGVVDIRDRDALGRAEHVPTGHVFGDLVHR